MRYLIKVWRAAKAEEMEVTQILRPSCAGGVKSGACSARPSHVVSYTLNKSGYPLLGNPNIKFACYRHVHGILEHAQHAGQFAVVSKYAGV